MSQNSTELMLSERNIPVNKNYIQSDVRVNDIGLSLISEINIGNENCISDIWMLSYWVNPISELTEMSISCLVWYLKKRSFGWQYFLQCRILTQNIRCRRSLTYFSMPVPTHSLWHPIMQRLLTFFSGVMNNLRMVNNVESAVSLALRSQF